MSLLPVTLW